MDEVTDTLIEISHALTSLASKIQSVLPDASLVESWGWQQPAITKQDMIDQIDNLITKIDDIQLPPAIDSSIIERLKSSVRTIIKVRDESVPNATGGNSYFSYIAVSSLISSLNTLIEKVSPTQPNWTKFEDQKFIPTKIKKRIEDLDSGVSALEKKYASTSEIFSSIDAAHKSSKDLPTTLRKIEEAKSQVNDALNIASEASKTVQKDSSDITEFKDKIYNIYTKSYEMVKDIDGIKRAAIRQGLGESFERRQKSLQFSTYALMFILAITLILASCIARSRIASVEKALQCVHPNCSYVGMDFLWANIILSGFAVSAPIWFSWLLTKQISQRFRLSEDYGYKAAVAKAYEGYRRESQELGDRELQKRLLAIALNKVEEAPLSHIEKDQPGGVLQSLISLFSRREGRNSDDAS